MQVIKIIISRYFKFCCKAFTLQQTILFTYLESYEKDYYHLWFLYRDM